MLAMASRDTHDHRPKSASNKPSATSETDRETHFATMADCARAWHWPIWRVKRLLRRRKAAKRLGGRWYTSLDLLRRGFPEDYVRMWAKVQQIVASKRTRTY